MSELPTTGKKYAIGELPKTESKCKNCEFYESCLEDPEFNEDEVDGCIDYMLKKAKTSIVVP